MSERPSVAVDATPWQVGLDLLALAVLVLHAVYVAVAWTRLPPRIPVDFGPNGQPEAWGGRWVVLLMLGVSVAMWAGLTVINRYPRYFNLPWAITEENAAAQYAIARTFVSALKAEITVLLAYIDVVIVRTAHGQTNGMGPWVVFAVLALVFGSVALFMIRGYRAR